MSAPAVNPIVHFYHRGFFTACCLNRDDVRAWSRIKANVDCPACLVEMVTVAIRHGRMSPREAANVLNHGFVLVESGGWKSCAWIARQPNKNETPYR